MKNRKKHLMLRMKLTIRKKHLMLLTSTICLSLLSACSFFDKNEKVPTTIILDDEEESCEFEDVIEPKMESEIETKIDILEDK